VNYTQLVTAIQDFTENEESRFVNQIPTMVRQAEQRIYNTVQLPALRKNVTGSTTASNQYITLPTDFLAPYSLALVTGAGAQEFLLNKDVNYIREAYPTSASVGQPKYYALFDANSAILGPTPDFVYGLELHYYYYPTSIVDAGTSWLGDNFDSALLYGTLVETSVFMKSEADMVALYETRYKEALMQLKRLGDGMDRRDAYRSGQTRVPVA
jgi:hypothetical protein